MPQSKKIIKLPQNFYTKELNTYALFDRINVFTGLNNSGKSYFLRSLFEKKTIEDSNNFFEQIITSLKKNSSRFNPIVKKFFSHYQLIKDSTDLELNFTNHELFINAIKNDDENSVIDLIKIDSFVSENGSQYGINEFPKPNPFGGKISSRPSISVFIPLFRSTRPFYFEGTINRKDKKDRKYHFHDLLSIRFFDDHFNDNLDDNTHIIFSGITINEDVKKLLLGSERQRKTIAQFEKFISEKIFEQHVTLIPKYGSDTLELQIGNEKQLPIYCLGDGIQSILIILFALFIYQDKNAYFFIEEPESHLHPQWQNRLLSLFGDLAFSNHTFLISSHSSIFINNSGVETFLVSKGIENNKSSETLTFELKSLSSHSDYIETLSLLGFKASDLLQSNYVIWVEGPSDIIYIRHWLKCIDDSLIEGIDFSFSIYGGNNLRHILQLEGDRIDLSIINALCFNFGFILDSDRTKHGVVLDSFKKLVHDQVSLFNKFCWIMERREIENYIDDQIYNQYILDNHKFSGVSLDNYASRTNPINNDKRTPSTSLTPTKRLKNIIMTKQDIRDSKVIGSRELRHEIHNTIQQSCMTEKVNKLNLAKYYVKVFNCEIHEIPVEVKNELKNLIENIKSSSK